MKSVKFQGVKNPAIHRAFLKVCQQYPELHDFELTLQQTKVKGSTMQAQPIIKLRNLFGSIKSYRIRLATFVRDSQELKVDDLPLKVLEGWFAHEMGHLVDYLQHSTFGMIGFGLRYLTSTKFQRQVEHKADEIAISHGFHEEILATKEYLLDHDLIHQRYKDKILKYYMSVENVKKLIDANVPLHPIS